MLNSTQTTNAPQPLMIDRREAARLLGITERTMHTLERLPKDPLPVVRLSGGRALRYSVLALTDWVARQVRQ
jgi:hypothetical protein